MGSSPVSEAHQPCEELMMEGMGSRPHAGKGKVCLKPRKEAAMAAAFRK